MASNNLFPSQGKVVLVTENHISAGLEYAKILANAESKSVIVNQKSSEDLYKKIWADKTAFMPKELTSMTYFAENFIAIKQPDGSNRKLSEKQIEEIKWFEEMSKTHTPKLIKMRRGGTKTIWVKKEEK